MIVRLLLPAELLLLELAEDVARGVIDHREAPLADLPGDGGGQVGLSQARRAEEQQVLRPFAEVAGVLRAAVVDLLLHVLPGGLSLARLQPVGIPAQVKGVKALAPQIQHPGELSLLLPGAVAPQAPAHPAVPVSGVAAEGAGRRLVQGVLRQAQLRQQLPLLRLEAQVLVPQHRDGGGGVRPPAEGAGDDPAHGGAELGVDLAQPGLACEDPLPPLPAPLLPLPAVLLEPLQGQAQHSSVIGHVPSSPPSHVFPGVVLPPVRAGGLRRRAVPGLDLLHRVEARLVPPLQDCRCSTPT